MGRYGYGPGVGGTQTFNAPPTLPNYGQPGVSSDPAPQGFQPRGFPEAIQANQFIPEQVGTSPTEFLDKVVFRGPAYVMERPLAYAAQALGMPQGEGLLDPVSSFFEDLPIVGEHLSNAGKLAEKALSVSQGAINSPQAAVFQLIADEKLQDTDQLPPHYSMWLTGLPGMTVLDFKKKMRTWGWTDADARAIASGEKGWLDFPEKAISKDPAADMIAKMLLDPLNVAMVGAPVLIVKAGLLGARGLEAVSAGTRAAKIMQSSTKATAALTSLPALKGAEAATAIAAGQASRATLEGLGMFGQALIKGGGLKSGITWGAKQYRRVAVGSTALQVGVNTVDAVVPDEGFIGETLAPVFEMFRNIGERKPLSNNDLFMLASLVTFPARGMAGAGLGKVRGKINAGRKFSHEQAILKALYPTMEYTAARAAAVARMGEPSFNAAMYQILRHALHEKNFLEGIASIPTRFTHSSLSELGLNVGKYNEAMNRAIRKALQEGGLTNRDAVRAVRQFVEGRGDVVREITGGVEAQFDPEDFFRAWEQWEPIANRLSSIFPEGAPIVPGLMTDVVIEEGIDWAMFMVKSDAKNGVLTGRELNSILRTQPGIYRADNAGKLAAAITRDGRDATFTVDEVVEALTKIRDKEAIPAAEYFAPQASREGWIVNSEVRARQANQLYNADGTIADDINPALSEADVIVYTTPQERARQAMVTHGAGWTENVRGLRGHNTVVAVEQEIPRGLIMGNLRPLSTVQVGLIEQGSTKVRSLYSNTGIAMRFNPDRPLQDLVDAAALGLETTKAPRATIIMRGETLLKSKGLAGNGIEYTWDVGRMSAREWDDLAVALERYGDRVVINDTTGLVRVIVPDGKDMQKALDATSKRLGTPKQDRVHFRDVVNRKKVLSSDPAGTVTLADAIAKAQRTRRYHTIRSYIDHGVGSVERGATVSVASRSPVAERARAAGRDHYANRPASKSSPTRWEREHRTGVRGRTSEHEVVLADDAIKATYAERLNAAGVRDVNPILPFRFKDGDRLFTTEAGDAGAVVRPSGELVLWLRSDVTGRRLPAPDDFGSVVSTASEHATWTRVVDYRDYRGVSPVDHLADHGWVPVAKSAGRSDSTVVWLVRDPDEVLGFKIPPPVHGRTGGWASVMNETKTYKSQVARTQTENQASSLYAERTARAAQAAKDQELLEKLRRIDDLNRQISETQAGLSVPRFKHQVPASKAKKLRDAAIKNKEMRGPEGSAGLDILDLEVLQAPDTRLFMSKDGTAGLAVHGDGELGMVFKQPGSTVNIDDLIVDASQDARFLTAYDVVTKVYERNGYRKVARVEFDPTQADVGATAARQGDVYFMVNERLAKQAVPDQIPTVTWDEAQALVDQVVPPGTRGTRTAPLSQSSTYRTLVADRDRLMAEANTPPAKARYDAIMEKQINPGVFTQVRSIEDDFDMYHPMIDESIEGNLDQLVPGDAQKILNLEAELRRSGGYYDAAGEWVNGSDYTLKIVPRHGTPYYVNQGEAYVNMMQGRMAMQDSVRDKLTSTAAQVHQVLFDRVYSRELAMASRQEVYNELLNKGASPSEVNQFIAALRHEWETQSWQKMGAKPRKSIDALSPSTINAVARGVARTKAGGKPLFAGFSTETQTAVGDFASVMQRAGSRTFRNLAKKYPATPGSGNLGKLIEQWYGKQTGGKIAAGGKVARKITFNTAFGYHLLRFILDPRWYLMNIFEGEVLGMARYGHKVRINARQKTVMEELRNRPGRTLEVDPAIEKLAGRGGDTSMLSQEEILRADTYASGWMDPRNLYGFVKNASRLQRPQVSRKILQDAIDSGSPVIDDLKAMWGDDMGTWVEQIEKQLYDIDTKGVRATLLSDSTAAQLANDTGPISHLYDEFLETMFKAHQKNYQDIVHTFHGNVNRSNLERLFNSPLLYWPMSYQLKTGKWLIDIMTKQFAGVYGHEMLGSATLAVVLSKHNQMMEASEEYAKIFDDHPALWRTLGMLLPMTPFDMGVFMARWTRYSGSWIGAQLGLWDQDPSYPQDPYNFVLRSLSLGPVFSLDIMNDILGEFNE